VPADPPDPPELYDRAQDEDLWILSFARAVTIGFGVVLVVLVLMMLFNGCRSDPHPTDTLAPLKVAASNRPAKPGPVPAPSPPSAPTDGEQG
jgi:hypothetical protein